MYMYCAPIQNINYKKELTLIPQVRKLMDYGKREEVDEYISDLQPLTLRRSNLKYHSPASTPRVPGTTTAKTNCILFSQEPPHSIFFFEIKKRNFQIFFSNYFN